MDNSLGYIGEQKIQKLEDAPMGRKIATTADGKEWTKKGNQRWVLKVEKTLPPAGNPTILAVVRQSQIEKVDHWCLFLGKEGSRGTVYQVMGDNTGMYYASKHNIDVFNSTSFHDAQIVNGNMNEHQQSRVGQVAYETTPPSAPSVREVKENCQGWVIKVLWQLQEEGMVAAEKIHSVELLKDPI